MSKNFLQKLISEKFGLVNPPIGNHPVFTANINNRTAKKNDGIAIPILVKTVSNLSNGVFHFTAAIIPNGTPTSHVKRITMDVKRRVLGIRSFNFWLTFSPVDVTPKSPRTNEYAHFPYCTIIGLSNPNLCLSLSTVAGETEGFNFNSANGSTGDNLIIKKLIKDTIISNGIV